MATCSYQTLARYNDDDCSRKCRARNLDDIRITHREALIRTRLQLKCLKMLQNRQSLVDHLFADDNDDQDNYYTSPSTTSMGGYDEPDDANSFNNEEAAHNPWLSSPNEKDANCCSPWSEEGSVSSDWSAATSFTRQQQYQYHHQVTSLSDLPESFLEDTSRSSGGSPTHRNQPRQRHSALYKQTSNGSPSPSSSPKPFCDTAKLRRDYEQFMNLVQQCPPTAQNLSHLIGNSWQTLLNAIQDPQLGKNAIEFVKSVCNRNLMTPETLISLLQHGLNLSLCNALYTLTDGVQLVCDLLVVITSSEPAIIPYLVEVMTSSKLSSELIERITIGSDSDTHAVIKFYHHLIEMILAHKDNPLRPLIPQVLLSTGVSQRTLRSYGPSSTLQKLLIPELIRSTATRCLSRTYSKSAAQLNVTLELLANIIKFAYVTDSEDWIVRTLCCLRDLDIMAKMNHVIRGLNRLARVAQSSDHSSQGVSLDQASASAQVCAQFVQFYQQYYNYLTQSFAAQLMACETGIDSGGKNNQSITTDSWILD